MYISQLSIWECAIEAYGTQFTLVNQARPPHILQKRSGGSTCSSILHRLNLPTQAHDQSYKESQHSTQAPPTFCIECPGVREYPRPLLLSKIHTRPQGTWGEGLGEIRHIRQVLEEIVGGERVSCEGVEEGEGGRELQGESERGGKEREASQTFPYVAVPCRNRRLFRRVFRDRK